MIHQRVPGGFKYEPRNLVDFRKQFGKSSAPLRPAPGVDAADPRFLAAQLQHQVANAVREAVLAQGLSLEAFLTRREPDQDSTPSPPPGMTYDRVVRINRGETLMQLADLVSWAQQFATVRALLADDQCWPARSVEPV
ncbi:hypothetical protein [Cryobacterium aureum]|uniref:hypothetical protein n=1 Tax=Cryobacterium aureum TaxID=995037 RepID=UPI000CF3B3C5|nr:hypothetical protein [Cryobacterium aureum]